jgi:hypothetical protein
MLTVWQVIRLYQEGFDVRFKRKPHPFQFKGEYDPMNEQAYIYLKHIDSKMDLDLTVLHESIHASRDILDDTYDGKDTSEEDEAQRTYNERPEILDFIKQIFFK